MKTFSIQKEFLLDGNPIKIISGAIHYFRLTPEQWYDSLFNLKALGANTVETYVPWNIHEAREGEFYFSDSADMEAFLKLAQEMGLLAIVRPSPYICAEWEFGGLPAWLLKYKGIRLRSTDCVFLDKVKNYYQYLLPKLASLQIDQGGPIIMMQVENEYGSYGMDKKYLSAIQSMMKELGITVPLFTSDGAWMEALDAGSLIEQDVLVTGNFGSDSIQRSAILQEFMSAHNKEWPIMCMEYWDGWFNRWGEEIVRRDAKELAKEVKDMLNIGSLNLYMFHGGTNFGFYNGCSARPNKTLPQVTSYDYDALLTEWGNPTEKYYEVQKVIHEVCPERWQAKPIGKITKEYGIFPVTESVSLFETIHTMVKSIVSDYPQTMEELDSYYGYVLYSMKIKNYFHESKLQVIGASDRLHVFADHQYIVTQDQTSIGNEIILPKLENDLVQLDILVENMGRVNYGFYLNHPGQSKGIRGGVMHDIHFHQGYTQYPLELTIEQIRKIDFSKASNPKHPSFYRVKMILNDLEDTFVDCSQYGKGVVFVNGHNLGRYWNIGPYQSLYCPKSFLKQGENEWIIFETEGIAIKDLYLVDHPVYCDIVANVH